MLSNLLDKLINNRDTSSVSSRLRKKRFSNFLNLLQVTQTDTILDVGGTPDIWIETGFEKNVTLLNITTSKTWVDGHGITHQRGDGCEMHMFEDNNFDIVFSNSVIEHVGTLERQTKFAAEIRRVGRKYWVQTPNRHFPVEPHLLFPFFQYLPEKMRKFIALNWKYSHFKKWNRSDAFILDEIRRIRLLTEQEMKSLFPDSRMYKETFWGLTKSLTAYSSQ